MSDTLIIIPTYNERENIEEFITEIFRHASDVDILVVDDNSPDGTSAIVDKIAERDKRVSMIRRISDRGRGNAGIDAFKEALKRENVAYIMEMDADFSHDPSHIPQFLDEIKRSDIVIGSRFIEGGEDSERKLLRGLLSKAVNFFLKRYLRLNVEDCSSGYRCFKRHVIASLELGSLISKGPAIIEEVLYISNLKKYTIKEIPIIFKDRRKGKTKLGFIKLLRVLIDIIRFKNRAIDIVRASNCNIFSTSLPRAESRGSKNIAIASRELRKFGFRFALALNILGVIMFYRTRSHFIWFTGIGSLGLIFVIICPWALGPIKKGLDFIISLIAKLINIISLAGIFYLIFLPIGLLFKIFGRDTLNQKIDRSMKSYWIRRKKAIFSIRSYERMG